MSCSGGKAWYVCSKGPFQGCCSIDPCNTGICPDDDNDSTDNSEKPKPPAAPPATAPGVSTVFITSITSTISTSTKTTTPHSVSAATATKTSTAATESISISTSTSASTLASTPLSSDNVSTKDSPSTTQTRTGLSTVLPTSSHDSSSSNKPNAGLIAGITAGVAVALALLCLLFCLIRRSRRRRGKRFTLLYWRGPKHQCNEKSPSPTRSVTRNLLASGDNRSYDSNSSPSHPPAAASRNSSITGPGSDTLVSLPSLPSRTHSPSITRSPSATLTAPSSTTFSSPSSTLVDDLATPAAGAGAVSISSNPVPSTSRRTSRRTTHSQQLEPTPELSDTGFYRQRAELAAHSARELINVPRHCRPSPRQSGASSSTSSSNLQTPVARPIVTADGVVLAPNLDRLVKDNSPGGAAASEDDHVMSFMRYDAAKDDLLPVYRGSWRTSLTGSANVTADADVSAWEKKKKEVGH